MHVAVVAFGVSCSRFVSLLVAYPALLLRRLPFVSVLVALTSLVSDGTATAVTEEV